MNSNLYDATTQNSDTELPNIDIDLILNNNVIETTIPKPVSKPFTEAPAEDDRTTSLTFLNPTTRYSLENEADVISNDITEEERHLSKHADIKAVRSDYKDSRVENTTVTTTTTSTTTIKTSTPSLTSKNDVDSNDLVYDEDDSDESYEDFAVEWQGTSLVRKNKVRVHISNEITAERGMPLRQGFLASTGYPNFYIGESNCSWTITAPAGHRIRLTVLDIHLRGK